MDILTFRHLYANKTLYHIHIIDSNRIQKRLLYYIAHFYDATFDERTGLIYVVPDRHTYYMKLATLDNEPVCPCSERNVLSRTIPKVCCPKMKFTVVTLNAADMTICLQRLLAPDFKFDHNLAYHQGEFAALCSSPHFIPNFGRTTSPTIGKLLQPCFYLELIIKDMVTEITLPDVIAEVYNLYCRSYMKRPYGKLYILNEDYSLELLQKIYLLWRKSKRAHWTHKHINICLWITV